MAFTSVDARGGGREKQGPDVLCAKCMAKGEHPIARAHVTVRCLAQSQFFGVKRFGASGLVFATGLTGVYHILSRST